MWNAPTRVELNAYWYKTMEQCELCRGSGEDVVIQCQWWRVILVNDPLYPGFCRVIWNAHEQEMSDLHEAEREELMRVVWLVEAAQREVFQPRKINLASLGNMVPHLHWHVIPRFEDDAHFPQPVWGQQQREPDSAVLEQRRSQLNALRDAIIYRLS